MVRHSVLWSHSDPNKAAFSIFEANVILADKRQTKGPLPSLLVECVETEVQGKLDVDSERRE